MLLNKTIAVVVPAYNEESQIGTVIKTMPQFVDRIIVVNDASKDKTEDIVKSLIREDDVDTICIKENTHNIEPNFFNRADVIEIQMREEEECLYPIHKIYNNDETSRIVLINNLVNAKVGGAIAIGYKWCRDHNIDCTAVMAGDAQMDPDELEDICMPVIEEGIDYVKGNRLSHKAAKRMIPPQRYFGNSVLSAMTKIASGYWHVSDTQTGYTAISLNALKRLNLYDIYPTYGCPNDILIKLNILKCTLKEIPIKPVYAVGEQSKMKIMKVIPTVSWLLFKGFFKRIFQKYFFNDFHPIFIFLMLAMILGIGAMAFLVEIIAGLLVTHVTVGTYVGFLVLFVGSILMFGFGLWIDLFENERLQK